MNKCRFCAAAEAKPHTGKMSSECPSCIARELAKSHGYFIASRAGVIAGSYKAALSYWFPNEPLSASHERVKAWADRIDRKKAA